MLLESNQVFENDWVARRFKNFGADNWPDQYIWNVSSYEVKLESPAPFPFFWLHHPCVSAHKVTWICHGGYHFVFCCCQIFWSSYSLSSFNTKWSWFSCCACCDWTWICWYENKKNCYWTSMSYVKTWDRGKQKFKFPLFSFVLQIFQLFLFLKLINYIIFMWFPAKWYSSKYLIQLK